MVGETKTTIVLPFQGSLSAQEHIGICSKMLWEHQGCSNLPLWQGVRDEDGIEGSVRVLEIIGH